MQAAVAIGYALAYIAIRPLSDAHWSLASGLRFACLLLVPYRYWLALAVGEAVPLIYSLYPCLNLYGYATTAIWSFPPIATAMPIAWFCRRHLDLFPAQRVIDVKALLVCTLATSFVWTLVTYAGLSLEAAQAADHVSSLMIAGLFVGDYVAILTIVTWPLLAILSRDDRSWKVFLSDLIISPLTRDAVLIAIPALAIIATGSAYVDAAGKAILEMSLFLPVAWLALKYGWRGAASVGPIAVACVCVLTQSVPDPAIIQTQAFVAFAVTCLFLMGARIASQIYVEERERHASRNALRVAQQCMYQADMRLRQTSQSLEVVGGSVSVVQGRIVERVRMLLSSDERQTLSRQASMTQSQLYRLAETIHPVAWRERGLPAALRETIGRALDEAGLTYACDIQGRGLSQLAPTVHQTIYRLATEAVAHVCGKQKCHQVRLVLRGGQHSDGQRWAVLRIAGVGDTFNTDNADYYSGGRPGISALLGTNGLDVAALRDQTALFDGMMHVKQTDGRYALTMLLRDAQHMSVGRKLEPSASKLWVR